MGVEGTFLIRSNKVYLIYKYTRMRSKASISRELNEVYIGV
jgi:hypothetical protein